MQAFMIGIVGSVIASAIYTALLYQLRPNITISKEIRMWRSKSGDIRLRVEVSNLSMQEAIGIFAELHRVSKKEGRKLSLHRIKLIRDDLMVIPPYDSNPCTRLHVFIFRTEKTFQNKDEILKPGSDDILRFRLRASHPWTHFVRVFEQQYQYPDITEGDFEESDEIIETV